MTNDRTAVTWKWLVGILVFVLVAGGSAWLTTLAGEQRDLRRDNEVVKSDIAVIKEQIKQIRVEIDKQGKATEDQTKKLDELLQRVRR